MLGGALPQSARPVLVKEHELVKDALNVLIGVVSSTFPLCQVRTLAALGLSQGRMCAVQGSEGVASAASPIAGLGEACR